MTEDGFLCSRRVLGDGCCINKEITMRSFTYCGGPHLRRACTCTRYSRNARHVEIRGARLSLVRSGRRRFTCGLSRVWRAIEPLPNFYRDHPYTGIPARKKEGTRRWTDSVAVVNIVTCTSPLSRRGGVRWGGMGRRGERGFLRDIVVRWT